MNKVNTFNLGWTEYNPLHYRAFVDWYAGLLFGFFVLFTIEIILYIIRNKKSFDLPIMGILLIYCGPLIHLPIKHRTYFLLPDRASLLGYKHIISIFGFSILVGWILKEIKVNFENIFDCLSHRIGEKYTKFSLSGNSNNRIKNIIWYVFVFLLCSWIIYCNYSKIAISWSFFKKDFPW